MAITRTIFVGTYLSSHQFYCILYRFFSHLALSKVFPTLRMPIHSTAKGRSTGAPLTPVSLSREVNSSYLPLLSGSCSVLPCSVLISNIPFQYNKKFILPYAILQITYVQFSISPLYHECLQSSQCPTSRILSPPPADLSQTVLPHGEKQSF